MQETQENWLWSLGQEDPLKKEMATHSSILGRRIPWTEEPGGLQSLGSQVVGYNWRDSRHAHALCSGAYGGHSGKQRIHFSVQEMWDMDSVPGSGRSPQVGTGNPLQYSCLGNFMGSGASWAAEPHGPQSLMGHGVAESDTTEYTHRLQMLYSANKNFFLVNN